jgi:hypothetical protein
VLYEPDNLYETARELSMLYLDYYLPPWDELSWAERDGWQARADELNEARYGNDS